jgi:hypothetical protein
MSFRFFILSWPLVVTAVVGPMFGCSCRPRMSSTELESLREGMAREMELQQAASDRRERAWEQLERSFDQDRDGRLTAGEQAAFDDYLGRVKQGRVPNPFLDKETPSDQ